MTQLTSSEYVECQRLQHLNGAGDFNPGALTKTLATPYTVSDHILVFLLSVSCEIKFLGSRINIIIFFDIFRGL